MDDAPARPIALLALLAGLRLIPNSPRKNGRKGGYDLPGALTGTAGMLLLVLTVVQAPAAGWGFARTLLCFALVAGLLTAFVVIEHRSANPLVRLGVLRSANQIRAHLGGVAFFGSYVGFQFLATRYMQYLLGWSALQTALAFLPAGALVTIASTRIGPVIDRFGTLRVIAVGFTALTLCYALFLRADLTPRYAAVVLPSMLLLGLACTLTFPSLNIQATNAVDEKEQGMVSGLLNSSFQIGGAVVLAVVTATVTATGGNHPGSPHRILDSYRPGLVVVTLIALAGLLVTLTGLRSDRRGHTTVGAPSAPFTAAETATTVPGHDRARTDSPRNGA